MLVQPNCKINIGLNVVERRCDGYHNLETIFYPIPLRENLEIKELLNSDEEYELRLSGAPIAGHSSDNLVVKVYLALKKEFDIPPLEIELYKKIPMGAGLGGGSSDAAFMMKAINEYYKLNLSDENMEKRMASFGADCAFFIKNKPAYATGIGDELSPCSLSLKNKFIVLVKPDTFISTKEAYSNINPHKPEHNLLKSIAMPIESWKHTIKNDFEESVFPNHPELPAIKQTLYDMGALYAAMSGSGSTLFGIFDRPTPEAETVFAKHFVFTQKILL